MIASVSATYCVPISSDLYLSNTGSFCVSDLNDIDRKNTTIIIYHFWFIFGIIFTFVHRNLLYFLSISAPLDIVTYTMAMICRWRATGASFPIHTDKMKRVTFKILHRGLSTLPSYSMLQLHNAKSWREKVSLQETNISPKNGILKMIFLFPRWDMLIPWRVSLLQNMSVTTANVGSRSSMRILILIFAEALGLYGLIVGLVGKPVPKDWRTLWKTETGIDSGKTYENFKYIYCLFTWYIYIYIYTLHIVQF